MPTLTGRITAHHNLIVPVLLLWAGFAHGYPVGPPLSLEKLIDESDFIFKGTAVSTAAVTDEWFKPVQGFEAIRN